MGAPGEFGVKWNHALETAAVRIVVALARRLSWPAARRVGAGLGTLAGWLGVRRGVARANLALAFPELSAAARERILAAHYRELGRVMLEYPQLPKLAHAREGDVLVELRGREHLLAARETGRGAILMTGHFGNFELMASYVARVHPVDVVVRPQSNPGVDRLLLEWRAAAGLGAVRADRGVRQVYAALRSGRWVAMLADQDARRHGVFVPFLGHPASTAVGPARLALALNVPILMGFCMRRGDGRYELEVEPPLWGDPALGDDAERDLTARHAARLEAWVRRRPEQWFWLHRRWKTAPPAPGEDPGPPAREPDEED
jgi:KDO2-lipid IV(A) lauroyltransferase